MKVCVVGSGGREHAIGWKLAQSPRITQLYFAPGNPGTAALGHNLPIAADDIAGLTAFALEHKLDLVVIGPEGPLAAGMADRLLEAGLRVFGPQQAAAQIESSKAFAKAFMARHHIPTAAYAAFSDYAAAVAYLEKQTGPVVLKASGLAAGKGVILPKDQAEAMQALHWMMLEGGLGPAAEEVIIEERLEGEEFSLLAFCDGVHVSPMPPAQDHKRLLDGDRGPNTGGMGAYAPAPICPPQMVDRVIREVMQPTLDGLRAEGIPFCGVLYAGMMLTKTGPRVLEFNARFGDPETQVILPLLQSDLMDILLACAEGRLKTMQPVWTKRAAVCVVMASEGYPGNSAPGRPVEGLGSLPDGTMAFHAGTAIKDRRLVTAGGRVLGICASAESLGQAVSRVYEAVEGVQFAGAQFRRDIAARALSAYAASGVDIDAGNRAVALMKPAVLATYGPEVLAGIGSFGGLYDASALKDLRGPVLVGSTDGVGTKVHLAAQLGRYRSVGHDIVNHCIDDILVQGARPLFFLDYFAAARLTPEKVAELVTGVAEACREAGCALLGGETAEMPGVYTPNAFDVAGTIVGLVDRDLILPRADLQAGDVLIGLASSGPHTNGYSLIRRIFAGADFLAPHPNLGCSLADALLAPHRSYLNLLWPFLSKPGGPIKALAHLTGGGFIENIPRVLPPHLNARVRRGTWPVPPLFQLIQTCGQVNELEMYRVFNMGIGMVAAVAQNRAAELLDALGEPAWVIGELTAGERRVELL